MVDSDPAGALAQTLSKPAVLRVSLSDQEKKKKRTLCLVIIMWRNPMRACGDSRGPRGNSCSSPGFCAPGRPLEVGTSIRCRVSGAAGAEGLWTFLGETFQGIHTYTHVCMQRSAPDLYGQSATKQLWIDDKRALSWHVPMCPASFLQRLPLFSGGEGIFRRAPDFETEQPKKTESDDNRNRMVHVDYCTNPLLIRNLGAALQCYYSGTLGYAILVGTVDFGLVPARTTYGISTTPYCCQL